MTQPLPTLSLSHSITVPDGSIFVCTTLVPILLRLQKLSQVQPERLIQFQSHSNGFYFYVYAEQGARCLVHCSSFTVVGCGDWQRSY
jgi:hypothetical protein